MFTHLLKYSTLFNSPFVPKRFELLKYQPEMLVTLGRTHCIYVIESIMKFLIFMMLYTFEENVTKYSPFYFIFLHFSFTFCLKYIN